MGEAYDIYSKAEVATGIAEAAANLNWPADRPVAANIGNFEVKTEGKLFSGLDFNTNEPTLTGSVIDDSGKRIGFVETYDSGFTFHPTGEEPSYFKAPLPNATMWNSEDGLIYGRGNAYVQRMDKIGPAAAELFTSMLGSPFKSTIVSVVTDLTSNTYRKMTVSIKDPQDPSWALAVSAAYEVRLKQVTMRDSRTNNPIPSQVIPNSKFKF